MSDLTPRHSERRNVKRPSRYDEMTTNKIKKENKNPRKRHIPGLYEASTSSTPDWSPDSSEESSDSDSSSCSIVDVEHTGYSDQEMGSNLASCNTSKPKRKGKNVESANKKEQQRRKREKNNFRHLKKSFSEIGVDADSKEKILDCTTQYIQTLEDALSRQELMCRKVDSMNRELGVLEQAVHNSIYSCVKDEVKEEPLDDEGSDTY